MAKREPTIEQNSHFTAKTKEGQDVEFETTVKFYISPTGQVTLSVPGGKQPPPSGPATVVAERQEVDRPPSAVKIQAEDGPRGGANIQVEKKVVRDETVDRAFPRGPEQPRECHIKEFIPDPCKAVDDAVSSLKKMYNNIFSGPKCPPPTNTDNLNVDYKPSYKHLEKDYAKKPVEVVDNEDNANKEMMENEQKYDM